MDFLSAGKENRQVSLKAHQKSLAPHFKNPQKKMSPPQTNYSDQKNGKSSLTRPQLHLRPQVRSVLKKSEGEQKDKRKSDPLARNDSYQSPLPMLCGVCIDTRDSMTDLRQATDFQTANNNQ